MFGYGLEEIIDKNVSVVLTEEYILSDILKDKAVERVIEVRAKSGNLIRVIGKFGPLSKAFKSVGGYAIFSDIFHFYKETAKLKEKENLLWELINNSSVGIVIVDQNHRVIETNKRFAEMIGYTSEEVLKLHTWDWAADISESEIKELFKEVSKINAIGETVYRRKDGSIYDVQICVRGTKIEGKNVAMCICQDISARKKAEEALRQSENKFRSFVENANDIILTLNREGIITYTSPNIIKLCGYPKTAVEGRRALEMVHPDDVADLKKFIDNAFNSGETSKELEIRIKNNVYRWRLYAIKASLAVDESHDPYLICIGRDITQRNKYEEKLRFLSLHDQLTGLYNRNYYEKALQILDKEEFYPISVLACDLDKLKEVNDTWGHSAGDTLLKDCAKLLKNSVRSSDMVARVGGDEFFIILPKTKEKKAAAIIKRIYKNIDAYNNAHCLPIKISIGFSTGEDKSKSLSQVLKQADEKMYAVKHTKELSNQCN